MRRARRAGRQSESRVSRSTVSRSLANALMSAAERVVPRARSPWAQAMRSELDQIDDDSAALVWALGCFISSFKLLVEHGVMNRQSSVSFALSFVAGTAIWALSPVVTGHTEPWDAGTSFYIAALLGTGLVVGFICPRKIWPVWVGLASGEFAYMLVFLPKGPLIALGFVFCFTFGVHAAAGAFVSSRLRRALSPRDDTRGPAR